MQRVGMSSHSETCRIQADSVSHGARRLDRAEHPGSNEAADTVEFTFRGERCSGCEGEPLLAALLAAGVRVLRTMPKSGEARGGYCLVGRCTDCLVAVDGRTNVRACVTPLAAGMRVEPQVGVGAAGPGSTASGVPDPGLGGGRA